MLSFKSGAKVILIPAHGQIFFEKNLKKFTLSLRFGKINSFHHTFAHLSIYQFHPTDLIACHNPARTSFIRNQFLELHGNDLHGF